MTKAFVFAFSDPAVDREGEYNDWYDNTHVPQLRAAVPSIEHVTRYESVPMDSVPGGLHRYLAIYEIATDDVRKTMAEFGEVVASGRLDATTAMDISANPPVLVWYQPRQPSDA